jgi:hypothetical protein
MKKFEWLLVVLGALGIFVALVSLFRPDLATPYASIASSVLSIAVAIIAYFTLLEMQSERKERNQPFVFVDFPIKSNGVAYYSIKNLGVGIAKDVTLQFDPVPIDTHGRPLNELPMFQGAIPILGPAAEIHAVFRFVPDLLKSDDPKVFTVSISYRDEGNEQHDKTFKIDLGRFNESIIPPADTEDHIASLSKDIGTLSQSGSQIKTLLDLLIRTHQAEVLRYVENSNKLRKRRSSATLKKRR